MQTGFPIRQRRSDQRANRHFAQAERRFFPLLDSLGTARSWGRRARPVRELHAIVAHTMVAETFPEQPDEALDQVVVMRCMAWQDYEALLAIRGDRSGVRMYYLDGEIEIMSPGKTHEGRKKTLARLLEQWALEMDVDLNGFGSWTLKKELREAGAEPDECYIVGNPENRDFPDLAIEIEWSHALGLPKREIYRRLGVQELWTIKRDGALMIQILEFSEWREVSESRILPSLDVPWLASFLTIEPQSRAVRELRDALRRQQG